MCARFLIVDRDDRGWSSLMKEEGRKERKKKKRPNCVCFSAFGWGELVHNTSCASANGEQLPRQLFPNSFVYVSLYVCVCVLKGKKER